MSHFAQDEYSWLQWPSIDDLSAPWGAPRWHKWYSSTNKSQNAMKFATHILMCHMIITRVRSSDSVTNETIRTTFKFNQLKLSWSYWLSFSAKRTYQSGLSALQTNYHRSKIGLIGGQHWGWQGNQPIRGHTIVDDDKTLSNANFHSSLCNVVIAELNNNKQTWTNVCNSWVSWRKRCFCCS